MDYEDRVTEQTNIGDILKKCPESESVFRQHFGEDCFSCPGAKLETISFGAAMHGLDAGPIVKELNKLLEVRLSGRRR
jgi:hybrid cluster-associated redox disulfide protein